MGSKQMNGLFPSIKPVSSSIVLEWKSNSYVNAVTVSSVFKNNEYHLYKLYIMLQDNKGTSTNGASGNI